MTQDPCHPIMVKHRTYEQLRALKGAGSTFDEVIQTLLETYETHQRETLEE